jgi:hypothetical protein
MRRLASPFSAAKLLIAIGASAVSGGWSAAKGELGRRLFRRP